MFIRKSGTHKFHPISPQSSTPRPHLVSDHPQTGIFSFMHSRHFFRSIYHGQITTVGNDPGITPKHPSDSLPIRRAFHNAHDTSHCCHLRRGYRREVLRANVPSWEHNLQQSATMWHSPVARDKAHKASNICGGKAISLASARVPIAGMVRSDAGSTTPAREETCIFTTVVAGAHHDCCTC